MKPPQRPPSDPSDRLKSPVVFGPPEAPPPPAAPPEEKQTPPKPEDADSR